MVRQYLEQPQHGLGKAYYQLDHQDELRAAVLDGVGRDFSLGVR